MKAKWLRLFLPLFVFPFTLWAQKNCGYQYVEAAMIAKNPAFNRQAFQSAPLKNPLSRTTQNTGDITIPVVFHIVLDSATLHLIGDSAGIADRVITQLQVINEDYNRQNADSTAIPAAFKTHYGNVNIKFGLAHTAPDGTATNGWDVVTTTQKGFNVNGNDPCYQAKHNQYGGTDAWDVTSYINIWIIDFLDGAQASNVIGLTIPPAFTTDPTTGFPVNEMGILINANAFGRRSSPGEYFYPGIDLGRTLTHEMGHYFGLFHTWGDDGGLCPGEPSGADDGIADTPPEGDAHYGCPDYPLLDNCSNSGSGVMFMNYMDYCDDRCLNMFTLDQIAVMDSKITAGGESFSLTTHSQLLQYPGGSIADNSFTISPNPASNSAYINFNTIPQGLQAIVLINAIGQKLQKIETTNQQTTRYGIDLNNVGKGMYFVKVVFDKNTVIKKIIVQ